MPDVSIVVTNYNGKCLLEKCIPAILEAVAHADCRSEIILVDDCSSDDSVSFIMGTYPEVRTILPPHNLGFQEASNFGVKNAKGEIVVLLNNDIIPEPTCISRLLRHFQDKRVFAVSAKLFLWDKTTYLAGKRIAYVKKGHFIIEDRDTKKLSFTLFATGGAAAFRKDMYLELGGFDSIYYPLYWEDIDLCYRAWKRGWQVLYSPEAIMYHKHKATITQLLGHKELQVITARNSYIFFWKNILDVDLFLSHVVFATPMAVRSLIQLNPRFVLALGAATLKLFPIIRKRKAEKKQTRLKDREILNRVMIDEIVKGL